MSDPINEEIVNIRGLWADEAAEQKRRAEAARRERMEARREALRKGKWHPSHVCDQCLRAILELRPEGVCEAGKQHGDQWWV